MSVASPSARAATGPVSIRVLPDPVTPDPGVLDYLSASRLKTWQSCRRQFYYRYVERIQTPTAPALFIGQAVHEILRLHNWSRWKDEPHDSALLREELRHYWEREAPLARVAWKSQDDEAAAQVQAWAMLEAYFEQSPVSRTEKPEGVEVRVECELGGRGIPPLIGIIDLVRPVGVIVDYKTAARTPGTALAELQHATQLACYALLYREATGQTETGFELHHLIKTKVPKIIISTFGPMSSARESELFFLIDDYLEGIAGERWIPSPGQHCSWCDYAKQCRAQSGIG